MQLHQFINSFKKSVDVVNAYTEVNDSISDLQYLRSSIKDEFSKNYEQAVRMEMKLVITPSIPLTTNRQQHRNNIPSANPEQYYRREITIPLLDRLTQEISLDPLNFLTKFQHCLALSHQSYVL